MIKITLAVAFLCAVSLGVSSCPANGEDLPGVAQIAGCKPGTSVRGSKGSGISLKAYTRFSCGSSVYVWNVSSNNALVQQGTTVAFVPTKYIHGLSAEMGSTTAATRAFLETI